MKILFRLFNVFFLLSTFQQVCCSQEQRNALSNYISNQDTSYSWQNDKVTETKDGSFYEINLVSQKWQNITWRHRLILYIPANATHADNLLLVVRHIYNRNAGFASLKIISDSTNTSSAIV